MITPEYVLIGAILEVIAIWFVMAVFQDEEWRHEREKIRGSNIDLNDLIRKAIEQANTTTLPPVTQWFSVFAESPVHEGNYDYQMFGGGLEFNAYFKNGRFYNDHTCSMFVASIPGDAWRGLSADPKGGA